MADEMPRCESCKHWEQTETYPHLWGDCAFLSSRTCERVEIPSAMWDEWFIKTRIDFGCVLWEPREGDQ